MPISFNSLFLRCSFIPTSVSLAFLPFQLSILEMRMARLNLLTPHLSFQLSILEMLALLSQSTCFPLWCLSTLYSWDASSLHCFSAWYIPSFQLSILEMLGQAKRFPSWVGIFQLSILEMPLAVNLNMGESMVAFNSLFLRCGRLLEVTQGRISNLSTLYSWDADDANGLWLDKTGNFQLSILEMLLVHTATKPEPYTGFQLSILEMQPYYYYIPENPSWNFQLSILEMRHSS